MEEESNSWIRRTNFSHTIFHRLDSSRLASLPLNVHPARNSGLKSRPVSEAASSGQKSVSFPNQKSFSFPNKNSSVPNHSLVQQSFQTNKQRSLSPLPETAISDTFKEARFDMKRFSTPHPRGRDHDRGIMGGFFHKESHESKSSKSSSNTSPHRHLTSLKGHEKSRGKKDSAWTKYFDRGGGKVNSVETGDEWTVDMSKLFLGLRFAHGAHSRLYHGLYKDEPVAVKIIRVPDDDENTVFLFTVLVYLSNQKWVSANDELRALMDMKAALDPKGKYLSSWGNDGNPCGGAFEGVACNEKGQVANISLQGKGLRGKLSPAIAGLKHLTGLYLHYNSLNGGILREIANLTELSDLYLNMNNLSGEIPTEIGNMGNLQVLQLAYNQLTGSIPTQLGSLKSLSVLALQSNLLTGAIPASLGALGTLTRLDLSFNHLFGSIPTKVADAPVLEFLDIRNNSLSGNVPLALKRLNEGFLYENNPGLCGSGFRSLKACNVSDSDFLNRSWPEPGVTGKPTREIPETADLWSRCNRTRCSSASKSHQSSVIVGTVAVSLALSAIGILIFTQYRRRKQRLACSFEVSDGRLSTDQAKGFFRMNDSPLIALEYPNGWDPLADGRNFSGCVEDVFQSFRFNLEEVETATQYFSAVNLLGKSNFSATYKGILRDGSTVAIKSISKNSCKSEEVEFLKGLNNLTSLKHEHLVRLRGFCCSRGRGECFLIYDFVPNGNLLQYLDVKDGNGHVLEWSTRVSIVKGIGKGIAYLHGYKVNKPALIHQNITAKKVLIDQRWNPLLADSGLQNLLTKDVVFSAVKASAAMGYLAPEYATTGRFTEKSNVYAFGVIVFQVLSGKRNVTDLVRLGAEACRFEDYIDVNLHGRFFEYEAAKLARIAWLCTHESPIERPSMEAVVQELGNCSSCL